MNTFIVILTPKRKAKSIQEYQALLNQREKLLLNEHFQYMEKLDEDGKILLGGPCLDAQRLVIIFNSNSLEETEELIKKDPTVLNKMVKYEIHPFSIAVGKLKSKMDM